MPNIKPAAPQQELRKHVSAIHVSGDLSILERKLVNVLLLNAYDDLLTKRKHTLAAPMLYEMVGFASNNIDHLKQALTNVMSTVITFDMLGDGEKKKKRWEAATPLAYAKLEDGICTYEYSESLAEKLANPDIYAVINVGVQRQFSSGYALALYENCVRFRRSPSQSTGWRTVALWRRLLGADAPNYDEFKYLSNEVIKPAVREVNQVSNITVTPEYRRESRKVSEIRFLVEENPQRSVYDIELEPQSEVRDCEAYKLLADLGIGDKLAVNWIQGEGTEKALTIARYVAEKVSNGQIKGSAGGYARTLFESGASVDVSPAQKRAKQKARAKAPPQPMAPSPEAEQRAAQTKASVRALTAEEKATLAAEFSQAHPAKSRYNAARDTFADTAELTAYRQFTRTRAAAVIAARAP
ncbi:replication initiation protein [Cupriavidus necator]